MLLQEGHTWRPHYDPLALTIKNLMKNVAEQIHNHVVKTNPVQWPSFVHELEKQENLDELLLQMITWMKCPNKSSIDDSATLRTIASILTSNITGNHTLF